MRVDSTVDYTVIIKWKNWYDLEVEELDESVNLSRKTRHSDVEIKAYHHHDAVEKKSIPVSDEKELWKRHIDGEMLDFARTSTGTKSSEQQVSSKKDVHCCGIHDYDVRKHTYTVNERLMHTAFERSPCCGLGVLQEDFNIRQPSNHGADDKSVAALSLCPASIHSSKHPNAHPNARNTIKLGPHTMPFSKESARATSAEVLQHSYCKNYHVGSTPNSRDKDQYCKSKYFMVEEGAGVASVHKGEINMRDVMKSYDRGVKRNRLLDTKVKDNCDRADGGEEDRIVKYERRNKRMRRTLAHGYEQGVVTCPVCQLAIPGDIEDPDFSYQMNMHVYLCTSSIR
ncbi:hypothetical protein KP509_16G030600 [Ceratopteris richardii]|uniref:Uncharacterized protein n=1 Tax=Ceratopteris richardii TaxID=49495 RepID=A0A8T2SXL2_CERRI|nr:hypothetical protein KP509_16G030600 [Ceratopteris richardii]